MPVTADSIEQALNAWLSSGPFADPDFPDFDRKAARWDNWLAQLTGDDIPVIVQEAVRHIDRVGGFAFSDRWLIELLSCLLNAARECPETYLDFAEQHRHTSYRALFLSTAGALLSDEVIEWLRNVAKQERLNESELRLVASSFYESGSPQGLAGLDQLLASIPAEHIELRSLIGDRRASLAAIIDQTG